jgi:hypothetical protein
MKTDEQLDIPVLDDIMGFIDYTVVQISKTTAMKWRKILESPPSWIRVTGIKTRTNNGNTEDSASISEIGRGSINVKVVHYGKNVFNLCVRGSPTKVDSGQNVVACSISLRAQQLRGELEKENGRKMKEEEVLIIQMYILMEKKLKLIGGLLEGREIHSIRRGEILVSNLTYAAYVKMGETEEERSHNFHTLCTMMRSEVTFGKGIMQMSNLIKRGSKVRAWSNKTEVKGELGFEKFTSLLMSMEVKGNMFAKMMMYQKDKEVQNQGGKRSNEGNTELAAGLEGILKTHIRIDCTFSSDMMAAILGKKAEKGGKVRLVLREALTLFSTSAEANKMVRDMFVYSGIPRLMSLTSLSRLERSIEDSDSEIFHKWKFDKTIWDPENWKPKKDWDAGVLRMFWGKYQVDLNIPYEAYCVLDRNRTLCCCETQDDLFAIETVWRGISLAPTDSNRELIERKNSILKSTMKTARSMRSTLFGKLPASRVRTNSRGFNLYRDQLLEVNK